MSERLRSRDLAFLAEETPTSPRHNATVEIFEPGDSGFDFARFVELVEDRISFVPRYRQRVQSVPGRLANPVWVDDTTFDLGYHLRRSALPRPGSLDQLRELVARIVSRPLDRSRPLWEIYVVEGLAQGRFALLYKTHQALADGVDTVDLGQLLLDDRPLVKALGGDEWHPHRRPSTAGLVIGALSDSVGEPRTVVDTLRSTTGSVLRGADHTAQRVGRVFDGLTGRRPESGSPLTGVLSQQRRVVVVDTRLGDHRAVRDAHGGTVNDVVLATITGALRAWLMTRGSLGGMRQIRAVVPVSVIDSDLEATSLGHQVAPHVVDLPVGEASPVVRLHQVSYSFETHRQTGRAVAARRLAGIAGFAPSTFHAIASRLAMEESRRGFGLSVTNVPGPQSPLYAAGAAMVATYPVHPLLPGHALAFGVTSYDGGVYYGLTADRDLVPDADLLGQCVSDALEELLEASAATRQRAPRGQARPRSAP